MFFPCPLENTYRETLEPEDNKRDILTVGKKKKVDSKKDDSNFKVIVVNKKARFNFHLVETFEAGLVLTGNEIKAIREGGVSLAEAYVRPYNGELWLLGCHITSTLMLVRGSMIL